MTKKSTVCLVIFLIICSAIAGYLMGAQAGAQAGYKKGYDDGTLYVLGEFCDSLESLKDTETCKAIQELIEYRSTN